MIDGWLKTVCEGMVEVAVQLLLLLDDIFWGCLELEQMSIAASAMTLDVHFRAAWGARLHFLRKSMRPYGA